MVSSSVTGRHGGACGCVLDVERISGPVQWYSAAIVKVGEVVNLWLQLVTSR